ncbi:hypothetical protein [Halorubellus sp. PRR65]|uniref:hypothetical protein n=1 Tax=Halorubellus sp. PRR65 TaxID=3098148 RepID=UPI002B257869|nr:hypothetical protein [Halorubellus sp. PRR65]
MAIDEFPDQAFLETFNTESITTAVNQLLATQDDSPWRFKKDLLKDRHDDARRQAGSEWLAENHAQRDVSQVVNDASGDAHIDAAKMASVLLTAEDLGNGWELALLPDGRAVINPHDESMTILTRPSLEGARGGLALDGTPTIELWRLLLGDSLQHEAIHTDEEKAEFLQRKLGLRIVRTSEDPKPYSSGMHVSPPKDLALIEGVGLAEQELPSLISSKKAIGLYEPSGLDELVDDRTHYGATKGVNTFAEKRVGIVVGSPHFGDPELVKWCALAGESVERAEEQYGRDIDYGDYGNKLLHWMRDQMVIQAVMRFGRDGGGATVYVHTSALPEWVPCEVVVPRIHTWVGPKDGMKKVIAAIGELDCAEWRSSEIVERVPLSAQQVRTHLNRLEEFGFLNSRRGSGRGKPFIWSDNGIRSVGKCGHVDFGV